MNDYEKYKGNFLKRNYMGELINDNGLEYQSRVGHWPEAEQLTDNSISVLPEKNNDNSLTMLPKNISGICSDYIISYMEKK